MVAINLYFIIQYKYLKKLIDDLKEFDLAFALKHSITGLIFMTKIFYY